jgi:hypothetical protein
MPVSAQWKQEIYPALTVFNLFEMSDRNTPACSRNAPCTLEAFPTQPAKFDINRIWFVCLRLQTSLHIASLLRCGLFLRLERRKQNMSAIHIQSGQECIHHSFHTLDCLTIVFGTDLGLVGGTFGRLALLSEESDSELPSPTVVDFKFTAVAGLGSGAGAGGHHWIPQA